MRCAQMDIVTHHAHDLVRFLTAPQSPDRIRLAKAWASALAPLETDPTLNLADQLLALRTRVRMARLGEPVDGLPDLVQARVAAANSAVCSAAMRHQIIHTAAGALSDVGLLDAAEQLLLAHLGASHAPFYFMHSLAEVAKKRGDALAAVNWYERAWDSAVGPATRLQWGAAYLQGLVDFAPHETRRIELFASRMAAELGDMGAPFCQRNRTQLERIDAKLAQWRGAGEQASALRRMVRDASAP